MPQIEADGIKTFDTESGTRLVLALEDAGIDILHRCGGNARCTTCRVDILDGDAGSMTELERTRLLRETDLTATTRLSCQVLVDSDLKVRVLNRLSETDLDDAGPRPDDTLTTE